MKKLIKDNIKILVIVIITAVVASVTSIFAYSLIAENVGYTPHDSTWDVQNVEAALNDLELRTKDLSSTYSSEETRVGQWINGKPLYQKTINFNLKTGTNKYAHNISDVDLAFFSNGFMYTNSLTKPLAYIDSEAGASVDSWAVIIYEVSSEHIMYRASSRYLNIPVYITIQYTKTTD